MLTPETMTALHEHEDSSPEERTYVAFMEDQLSELRDMLFQGTPDAYARYMLDIASDQF